MRTSKHAPKVAENGHAPAQRTLAELSVVELKALSFDQLAQIQACQNNLKLLNEEIQRRVTPEAVATEP